MDCGCASKYSAAYLCRDDAYLCQFRHSIVASIPACHAGDQGSIPCVGVLRASVCVALFCVLKTSHVLRNYVIILPALQCRGQKSVKCGKKGVTLQCKQSQGTSSLLVELRRVLPLSMPRQIDGDATQVN